MNPLAPVTRTGPMREPAGWIIMGPRAWGNPDRWRTGNITKATTPHDFDDLRSEARGAVTELTNTLGSGPPNFLQRSVRRFPEPGMCARVCRWEGTFPGAEEPPEDSPGVSRSGGYSATHIAGVGVLARFESESSDPGRSPCAPIWQWPLALRRLEMAYLDVSPMIIALRTSPSDFEMKRGWLRHFPSRHEFKFDREGNVRLHARCDCAMLAVRREQGLELWQTFQQWHVSYWRPIEINKEFASHFREAHPITPGFRRIIAKLRRAVLLRGEKRAAAQAPSIVPAE